MLRLTILFCILISLLSLVHPMPTQRRSLEIDASSLPPAVESICNGGQNATTVLESKPFGTDGVTITTGVCTPPTSHTSRTDQAIDRRAPPLTDAVCTTALNNCVARFGTSFQGNGYVGKCGAPCLSTCYPGSNGPNPNDCQFIFNSMFQQNPQLFILNPNAFVLLTYASCGTGIQNQIASSSIGCSQTMIYDYQDWAWIGGYLAWNCQAPQGARGGKCLGTTGLYQPSIADFYIQVYQNV